MGIAASERDDIGVRPLDMVANGPNPTSHTRRGVIVLKQESGYRARVAAQNAPISGANGKTMLSKCS